MSIRPGPDAKRRFCIGDRSAIRVVVSGNFDRLLVGSESKILFDQVSSLSPNLCGPLTGYPPMIAPYGRGRRGDVADRNRLTAKCGRAHSLMPDRPAFNCCARRSCTVASAIPGASWNTSIIEKGARNYESARNFGTAKCAIAGGMRSFPEGPIGSTTSVLPAPIARNMTSTRGRGPSRARAGHGPGHERARLAFVDRHALTFPEPLSTPGTPAAPICGHPFAYAPRQHPGATSDSLRPREWTQESTIRAMSGS